MPWYETTDEEGIKVATNWTQLHRTIWFGKDLWLSRSNTGIWQVFKDTMGKEHLWATTPLWKNWHLEEVMKKYGSWGERCKVWSWSGITRCFNFVPRINLKMKKNLWRASDKEATRIIKDSHIKQCKYGIRKRIFNAGAAMMWHKTTGQQTSSKMNVVFF